MARAGAPKNGLGDPSGDSGGPPRASIRCRGVTHGYQTSYGDIRRRGGSGAEISRVSEANGGIPGR